MGVYKMPKLDDALQIALEVHSGKTDKGGNTYILHPLRVMMKMSTEEEMIVAVLHDVVEDSDFVTIQSPEKAGFPNSVIEAVDCLTRRKGESFGDFIVRIEPNPLARKLKLADLGDNMDIRRLSEIKSDDFERLKKYRLVWNELRKI